MIKKKRHFTLHHNTDREVAREGARTAVSISWMALYSALESLVADELLGLLPLRICLKTLDGVTTLFPPADIGRSDASSSSAYMRFPDLDILDRSLSQKLR